MDISQDYQDLCGELRRYGHTHTLEFGDWMYSPATRVVDIYTLSQRESNPIFNANAVWMPTVEQILGLFHDNDKVVNIYDLGNGWNVEAGRLYDVTQPWALEEMLDIEMCRPRTLHQALLSLYIEYMLQCREEDLKWMN